MTQERISIQATADDLTRVIDAYIEDDEHGKWICRKFESGIVERVLTIPSEEWHAARAAEQAASLADAAPAEEVAS